MGSVLFLHFLDASFDFANRLQIITEHRALLCTQAPLKIRGLFRHLVQNASVLLDELLSLLWSIALAEEPLEKLARVDFHRQRRGGCPERDRGAVTAAVVAITTAPANTAPLGGNFERGKRRVLADVLGGNLIRGHTAIRILAFAR